MTATLKQPSIIKKCNQCIHECKVYSDFKKIEFCSDFKVKAGNELFESQSNPTKKELIIIISGQENMY